MTWLSDVTFDTAIVHTQGDNPSLKGVVAAVHDDCLILRDTLVLEPEAQTLLEGDCVVPRASVWFVQKVDG
jgi:hypothetical protein